MIPRPSFSHSPEYREACVNEYHNYHYSRILAALRKVDRARHRLLAAHNCLLLTVRDMDNPYAEQRFNEFYQGGGVTAQDWVLVGKPRRVYNQDVETCPVLFPLRLVQKED